MKLDTTQIKYRQALIGQYFERSSGILHLGAHLGQEAARYHSFKKKVIWVEALPQIHSRLKNNLKNYDSQKALCALLGDSDGLNKEFYISNNSEGVSSSIFEFGEYADGENTLWPELGLEMISEITLPMTTLDTLLNSNNINSSEYEFWIMGLQGAELLALKGGEESLNGCKAIYIEVSTVEVYRGGVAWEELEHFLVDLGFRPLWQPSLKHDDVLFVRDDSPLAFNTFHSDHYLRHNKRRQEHLSSLNIDIRGKSVFEVGAGIGDHTSYFLDRDCSVLTSDIRPENYEILKQRFAGNDRVRCLQLDMDNPIVINENFEIIYCYGLLYHLENPKQALDYLSSHCTDTLLLETCVSNDDTLGENV